MEFFLFSTGIYINLGNCLKFGWESWRNPVNWCPPESQWKSDTKIKISALLSPFSVSQNSKASFHNNQANLLKFFCNKKSLIMNPILILEFFFSIGDFSFSFPEIKMEVFLCRFFFSLNFVCRNQMKTFWRKDF